VPSEVHILTRTVLLGSSRTLELANVKVVLYYTLHVIYGVENLLGGLVHGDDGRRGLQQVAVPFPALSW
jgi:hypothetical protein